MKTFLSPVEISEAFMTSMQKNCLPKTSHPNFLQLYNKKIKKDVDSHEAYQFLMKRKKHYPTDAGSSKN